MSDRGFWDVKFGYHDPRGYFESSVHVSTEFAQTADKAIALGKEWRDIDGRELVLVYCQLVRNGDWGPYGGAR